MTVSLHREGMQSAHPAAYASPRNLLASELYNSDVFLPTNEYSPALHRTSLLLRCTFPGLPRPLPQDAHYGVSKAKTSTAPAPPPLPPGALPKQKQTVFSRRVRATPVLTVQSSGGRLWRKLRAFGRSFGPPVCCSARLALLFAPKPGLHRTNPRGPAGDLQSWLAYRRPKARSFGPPICKSARLAPLFDAKPGLHRFDSRGPAGNVQPCLAYRALKQLEGQ
jgi:hypothetical protein